MKQKTWKGYATLINDIPVNFSMKRRHLEIKVKFTKYLLEPNNNEKIEVVKAELTIVKKRR